MPEKEPGKNRLQRVSFDMSQEFLDDIDLIAQRTGLKGRGDTIKHAMTLFFDSLIKVENGSRLGYMDKLGNFHEIQFSPLDFAKRKEYIHLVEQDQNNEPSPQG